MTIEEILRDAIQGEQDAYQLYTRAADMVRTEHVKDTLRELAGQELGHKATLEKMLQSPGHVKVAVRQVQAANVQDYKVADHLVARPLGPDSTFQDVCIFASKKEAQSHELYTNLAAGADGEIRDLFLAMAKDELRHKDLVERWYEEVVYQEF